MLSFFKDAYGPVLAVDPGSQEFRIYRRGRGLVLAEPSVLALRQPPPGGFPEVVGVGEKARALLFKAPRTMTAEQPVREGTIADPDLAALLVEAFFLNVFGKRGILRPKPRVLIGIPANATRLERAAFFQAFYAAGCSKVYLIERVRACAMELSLTDPRAVLVLDIGREMTEAAVLSMGSIVHARSVRSGSSAVDRAVISHVRSTYNLLIGETFAEDIKKGFLSAVEREEVMFDLRGRDLITNLPRSVSVSNLELLSAISRPLENLVHVVTDVLTDLSPEVSCDLMESGLHLVGGGAMLDGLPEYLTECTSLPVHRAGNPPGLVISGLGNMVERFEEFEQVFERG